ncbi:hypothetical protein [uncultured Zhongshania sp.]|uniref:hypothetical protein n=1 Tax=uncultured Zhongshania sp. TaxID=1642288 RepID=UPI0030DCC2E1
MSIMHVFAGMSRTLFGFYMAGCCYALGGAACLQSLLKPFSISSVDKITLAINIDISA